MSSYIRFFFLLTFLYLWTLSSGEKFGDFKPENCFKPKNTCTHKDGPRSLKVCSLHCRHGDCSIGRGQTFELTTYFTLTTDVTNLNFLGTVTPYSSLVNELTLLVAHEDCCDPKNSRVTNLICPDTKDKSYFYKFEYTVPKIAPPGTFRVDVNATVLNEKIACSSHDVTVDWF